MFHPRLSLVVVLLGTGIGTLAQEAPMLYYPLDEGRGRVAADASGNKLDGVVSADWTDSPSGKALSFDGRPAGIIKVQLPVEQRFGKDSWTFSAWIKPSQFTIDDPQNQRRLFAFGTYPDAYLVIDILSTGQLSFYFCYRPGAADATFSAGGSSAARLKTNQWAHVALVCDRKTSQVETYINGFSQGVTALSPDFAGDFSLGGELTLGSGWHNYQGLMDEVKVYRRALPRTEVKAEFARLKATFGVTESPEAAAAEKRELLLDTFAKTHEAWASGDYAAFRAACAGIIASPDAAPSLRSYADLRSAQSYAAEGKSDLAKTEYARIATNTAYPLAHRGEASECEAELERNARGLPSRDPAASRTTLPPVQFAARVVVSPEGSDSNDGAATSPVATLTRARDRVRAMKAAGTTGAISVAILPGEYRVVTNSQSGITPILTVLALAPGASTNFTGSYFAPTNCTSTSTSTATAQSLCGIGVTNTATTICPITTLPLLAITQNCPINPVSPGSLLTYTGSVSNAGNVALNNIIVTNSQSGITPLLTVASLVPGATTNFTGSYFAPTNCSSTSIATATAQSLCGVGVTNTATTVCPISTLPLLAITQNCPINPVSPGSLLTYTGSVSNAGDVALNNIIVTNSQSGITPILTVLALAPGATTNFTGSYFAPTNCSSTSIATATAQSLCGVGVTNTAITICPITTLPLLAITQNCPINPVSPGSLLTYTGTVSNAGNITLNNIIVTNSQSGITPLISVTSLAPGATTNFTGSYFAPTNCSSTSTSTATAQSLCGIGVTNTATTICPITTTPLLAVTQVCPVTPAVPGGLLTYSGTVSNAGDITLNNIIVTNSQSGITPILTVLALAPGATTNFTGSYFAPTNCSSTSTSTATAQSLCGIGVTNTATTICPITTTPSIVITETCPPGPVSEGSSVTFGGSVENTGNITLTNVLVFSSQGSSSTPLLGPITLAPGASEPFTGSYIATGGSNPTTNSTIVTNSSSVITTNTVSSIVTNNTSTVTTNTVTPTFGTIDPVATTLTDRFNVPSNLHGLMYADQDENWGPTLFYSTWQPASGADTFDTISTIDSPSYVGSLYVGLVMNEYNLTYSNYDALTLAAPDVGYGAVNFYYVCHDSDGVSHFGVIKAAGATSDSDLPAPLSGTGYTGLAFAAANVGYGADMFYYVRNDAATGLSMFGTINPTPGLVETDLYSVGTNFDSLVFVPGAVSTWGTGIFAYLHHDNTGSIIGTINPVTQVVTDRIDLGTNFLTALTFTATDVGYGPNLFYYLRPAETILTTNTVTNFTTNIVITLTTNTVSTYTTNSVVTFTATNTVMTSGMDICQGSTVAAAANCLGPVALALAAPQFRWPAVASALAAPEFSSSALANGLFRLSFRSQNGTSYTIQYKNALADPAWTDLETVLGTGGNLSITDRDSAQRPSRFYRIILTP